MSTDNCSNATEHFRKLYGFGYHPIATRAALLLRISTHVSSRGRAPPTEDGYQLCTFTTEGVLSLCVDKSQVLVVDITTETSDDFSKNSAPICLVVDDSHGSKNVATTTWSETYPPQHFIFEYMSYDRAFLWVQQWTENETMEDNGMSLDMHKTCANETNAVSSFHQSSSVVELTLPSTMRATQISDNFLSYCTCMTFLDMSSLVNATQIGHVFLGDCAGLTSVDLSPLANVREIGAHFLDGCHSLVSVDLSPLNNNVCKIGDRFLAGCTVLTSLNLSPLKNVTDVGYDFLADCHSLTSVDLSPLSNVGEIGSGFLCDCHALS
eukprot:PhM_4_TR8309/c0_g1_i2/m.24906